MAAVGKPGGGVVGAVGGLGNSAEEIGRQLGFYVRILGEIARGKWLRRRYRSQLFGMISDITIGASALIVGGGMVFVILSMSFFTGTEVGLQGFKGLEQIGAQSFTGLVGAFANTREVTPLIAGVAFAAQVGAGFTAELGAMRISDEIDALEVMSVPTFTYLVCTRVVAAVICILPLYLFSLFASFLATSEATAGDVFVGNVGSGRASAIVVLEIRASGVGGPRVSVDSYVDLSLVKVEGTWKVDGVRNLNLGVAGGGTAPPPSPAP